MAKAKAVRLRVKEVLANGDQRCEVRWPPGVEKVESPVKDWRLVRDVNLEISSVTGEAVLSFTRSNGGRLRRRR